VTTKIVEEIALEFTLGEFAPNTQAVSRLGVDKVPGERVEGLLRDLFTYLRPVDRAQPLVDSLRDRKS
jgi:hypothetical protein